jgi:hypothetical protein
MRDSFSVASTSLINNVLLSSQETHLEAMAPDSLCEPMHDAKKLDNGRKVRIKGVLEFGRGAPA